MGAVCVTSRQFGVIFVCRMELIVASAVSKMVASTATYPHEVIRSRMHVAGTGAFSGLRRTCQQILREDGMRGFYHGCVTNLLRTTPAAAVTFTSFELINRHLRNWIDRPMEPNVDIKPTHDLEDKKRLLEDEQNVALGPPFASVAGESGGRSGTFQPSPAQLEAHVRKFPENNDS